jgi:hypothetical protein
MAIELHCNHCGKLVRAPDDAGGKHGKCPSCHQSVYIPTPPDQLEALKLEPVDSEFERRKARLMHETAELVGKIAREREGPEKPGDRAERLAREEKAAAARAAGGATSAAPARPAAQLTPSEANELVIDYVVAMFEGRLAEAQVLADELRASMKTAEDAMQRIVVDEIPPTKLAKVPRPLIIGFFKQLREQK